MRPIYERNVKLGGGDTVRQVHILLRAYQYSPYWLISMYTYGPEGTNSLHIDEYGPDHAGATFETCQRLGAMLVGGKLMVDEDNEPVTDSEGEPVYWD